MQMHERRYVSSLCCYQKNNDAHLLAELMYMAGVASLFRAAQGKLSQFAGLLLSETVCHGRQISIRPERNCMSD